MSKWEHLLELRPTLREELLTESSGLDIQHALEMAIKAGKLRPKQHHKKPNINNVRISSSMVQVIIAGDIVVTEMSELLKRLYGLVFVSSAPGLRSPSLTFYKYRKGNVPEVPAVERRRRSLAPAPLTPKDKAAAAAYNRRKRAT